MYMRKPCLTFDKPIEIENKEQVIKDVDMVCRSNGIKNPEASIGRNGDISFTFDNTKDRDTVVTQLLPIYG